MTRREYVDKDVLRAIAGFSGTLVLLTNIGHNSSVVGIYEIPWRDIRADSELRIMLFGRVSSVHALKIDKLSCNYLADNGSKYLRTDFFKTRDEIETECEKTGINAGKLFEIIYAKLVNGLIASIKQDVNQKIDIIGEDGRRYQLKASIAFSNNHGSYSTSNGRAIN